MLDAQYIRNILDYEPETGLFRWRVKLNQAVRIGAVAGKQDTNGYIRIGINKRHYLAHRLVWLYVHGDWPKDQIDHINRNQSDNRIANLRDVSQSVNSRNKRVKASGITLHKKTGKWQAQVSIPINQKKYLGLFETREAAALAYETAKFSLGLT